MNIVSGTKYRSIASQNILSYLININIDNTSGISSFGFSGDNGNLNLFTFKTGKIYDINNRHVWSYNPSENINISGNINSGDLNYFINNNIVCLSSPKNNNYYKYFYASSENCSTNLNSYIYGNIGPNYSIEFPFKNLIGEQITGYIKNISFNNNSSFQFFSGQSFVNNDYYRLNNTYNDFISGAQSGKLILDYVLNQDPNIFSTGVFQLNFIDGYFLFNTNFGNISYDFNIPVEKLPFYYLDFVTIFTGIVDDITYNYNYNYNLQTKSPENQDVFISLVNHLGHTGDLYYTGFLSTGLSYGVISGFIHGDDYITGISSGFSVSLFTDYYGNNLSTGFISTEKQLQYPTGNVNYYYNIPIHGGSGLSPARPNTTVFATGYIDNFNEDIFIYKSRDITGAKSGLLTGFWYEFQQTGSGLIFVTESSTIYFTGNSDINYINFNWNTIPYISFDIDNYNSNYNYKIYGITGSGNYTFTSSDSGILEISGVTTQQRTGELINYIFKLNSIDIANNISGDVFGSENTNNLIYVFGEGSLSQWGTNTNTSTGYLGFEFKNFSAQDSGIISHYELNLDKNFSNYKFFPFIFKVQGSNDNLNWNEMDTRSGINFYNSPTNIFQITGTGLYNYIRFLITSGQLLSHINQSDLNNANLGLSINKIYFYEKSISNPISGLYKNFIDNDITGDYFYSSLNTGSEFDYLFSNDYGIELYSVSKLDKQAYPYVEITGGVLGYKTAYPYTGNIITGFYVSFENGYLPDQLIIDASTGGINYTEFYRKTGTINTIESGFISGIRISGVTGYQYFRFNFTGAGLTPVPSIRIQKANLYTIRNNNFFDLNSTTITGYGNVNVSINGSGTGFLTNPTGKVYQTAIFYQTGLLTGLIDSNYSSYTWYFTTISGTGLPNKVFDDYITGQINATGLVYFNTGLLYNEDLLRINNFEFTYVTGAPSSNYEFNNLSGLINILNSGATGGLVDNNLQFVVGVTGYVHTDNSGITLFSYYKSGEDGNTTKLTRYANNLSAINIPHRYFRSGQDLRYSPDIWTGVFSENFNTLSYENTGFYTINIEYYFNNTIIGVIFENNFTGNWVTNITPFSEGKVLNPELTITLPYYSNINFSGFSGSFNIKSGLGYLGYSGLNIFMNKRSFNSLQNTGNFAKYMISGKQFLYTGILEG